MRILVVEDDEYVAKTLKFLLASHNYAVDIALDGDAGSQMAYAFEYDLVLLDVILPDQNGVSLCQQFRASGYQMPILLLTGQDGGHLKAIALNTGADDYVVKPFDSEELVARVQALLRRSGSISHPIMGWGNLRLDPSSHTVAYATHVLSLTPKEYAILELFLRNSQRVLSSGVILDHVWTSEETPGEETVRVHIKGLRQKLKAAGAPADFIETVYRVGYRLRPLELPASTASANQQPTLSECSKTLALGCSRSQRPDDTQPKVLVFTNHSNLLTFLKNLLEPQALQIITVNALQQFWQTLKACSPDLLILDVEMTDVSSLQLCEKMRHMSDWKQLPIIFLLPSKDTKLVNQVFAAGANDFVSQPIVGPELVTRVLGRLQRVKR